MITKREARGLGRAQAMSRPARERERGFVVRRPNGDDATALIHPAKIWARGQTVTDAKETLCAPHDSAGSSLWLRRSSRVVALSHPYDCSRKHRRRFVSVKQPLSTCLLTEATALVPPEARWPS